MSSTNAQLYEVAIGMIPGIGPHLTKILVSYCGSAEAIFKEKKGKLLKIPGIGVGTANAIVNQNVLKRAEMELLLAEHGGIKMLFYTSAGYPSRLKNFQDAPCLIYYKGNADLDSQKVLAIVGTRNATDYGKEIIVHLVKKLSRHKDLLIVSGLAYGIDIAAHKASLKQGISTIGVIASGIDIIYPALHQETAKKMSEAGGILSEYPMGSKPEPARFPARNRIIAGLSDAVLVVEAAEKGGALITADLANAYGRRVFAVPGNVRQKYSEGCNQLIRDHKAILYMDTYDLEKRMQWDAPLNFPVEEKKMPYAHLQEEAKVVVHLLQGCDGMMLDDLSWKSLIPLARLASLLLHLEFEGIIKSLPGKKYKLISGE